ncbi:MAG: ATP-binding cassette domain-containing protein, partial [Paludibacteraceae bacterium]|nr:ATP-binding cassette domain-containing protein [Paludibacteraceae bacterium]
GLSKPDFDEVVCMTNVNVSDPGRTLFKDLNWRIMKGEKWSLSGQNGSGKSTLLSLLSADNPKAYSLDIRLFGRQRGTGESIWDIKRHIGYISSEMHLYFRQDQPCKKIVASGFFDTIGLFRTPTDAQYELALQWMKLLGIDHLAEQSFLKVSGGEQRLVLICRTMVKNPDLLILDEPLHGLDLANKRRVREIVEKYAAQDEKTLIYVTHRKAEIPSCVTKHFEIQKLG